jgi:hypothetical protein
MVVMNTLVPTLHILGSRVTAFALVVAAFVAGVSGANAQTSRPLDLDGDGTPEFLNVTTTSGSPIAPGIAAHLEVFNLNDGVSAITTTALAKGTSVGAQSSWGASTWSVGYSGIRFASAAGIHYGWIELVNPFVMGRPTFQLGGWGESYYFNPEPNQPLAVGDTTLKLSLSVHSKTGKLRLKWNTEAAQWVNGLRIQSRPIDLSSGWTSLKTVTNGTETEIDLNSTSRMFRAVHSN